MTDEQETPESGEGATVKTVWLADGLPCFVGDIDGIIPWAREQGYSTFYIIGSTPTTKEWVKENNVNKAVEIPGEPRLFKVVANAIGHVIREADATKAVDLREYAALAWFELPKIPWEMIEKMDQFFRKVYDKVGTEAIAILTFDPRVGMDNREGWGILIPKQENSPGHCKYDPQSIIDDKDDELIIVGTAHSHPAMSAFASHTDHNDQFGNDGIHITYGWTAKSDFTEFHIELQMAGVAYEMKMDQAFEAAPKMDEAPEVEDWTKKVSRQVAAGTSKPTTTYTTTTPGGYNRAADTATRDPSKHYTLDGREYELPEGAPSPKDVTVVTRVLDTNELTCPICKDVFRNSALERRRCWSCYSFFMVGEETIEDIIAIRDKRNDAPVFELMPEKAPKTIMVYNRWTQDGVDAVQAEVEIYHTVTGKVPAQ